MSRNKVRLSMEVTSEVDTLLNVLADDAGVSRTEIVRRALAFMKAARDQRMIGRKHVGFTSDPSKLEAEVIGVVD